MSKKESMVKRKFSFELPKLKLGSSKSSREQSRTGRDSPPTTPRSVRPPLSPRTDHQLRLACAYILQDFKPSHQIYEEKYGTGNEDRPQLSYPTGNHARARNDGAAEPPVVRDSSSRRHRAIEASGSGKPEMKPTIKSQAFFEGLHIDSNTMNASAISDRRRMAQMVDEEIRMDLSHSNPPIASPAFFAGVDLAQMRREYFPTASKPGEAASIRDPALAHQSRSPLKRSVSNPVSPTVVPAPQHSKKPARSDIADTTASSPRTDGTENAWSNSTAPTTTVATPARGSLNRQSQTVSSEKFLTSDIEWMRKELETHKRAQDEARAQLELENQVLASIGLEPRSSLPKSYSATNILAAAQQRCVDGNVSQLEDFTRGRKANQSIQERRNAPPVPLLDSMRKERNARSGSRRQRSAPRSESGTELDMLRSAESRRSREDRRGSEESFSRSQNRSISRSGRADFNHGSPITFAAGESSTDVSRASSRSRRLFQIHVRPHNGTGAPPGSLQSSKPQSRSRSIESIRSAMSGMAPKSWGSLSKSRDRGSDHDSSRPGTALSKRRSRDLSHESMNAPDSRSKKGRSNINLNRELPPLPSLDQWKPEDAVEERPELIASVASPTRSSLSTTVSPVKADDNALDGSSGGISPGLINHSATTSRIQSIYSRYSKIRDSWRPGQAASSYSALNSPTSPPEMVRPGVDQALGSNSDVVAIPSQQQSPSPSSPAYIAVEESPSPQQLIPPSPAYAAAVDRQQRIPSEYMFHRNFGAPSIPASPGPSVSQETSQQSDLLPPPAPPKTIKRRTEDMFLPDLDARARSHSVDASGDNEAASPPPHVPSKPGPMKRQNTLPLLYKPSTNMSIASTDSSSPTSALHSKSQSEQINFSRKPETDNYSRLYDMGYRNIVHLRNDQRQKPQQQHSTIERSNTIATPTSNAVDPATLPVRKESKRWWKRATSVRKLKDAAGVGLPSRSSSRMWKGEFGGMVEDESAPTVVGF